MLCPSQPQRSRAVFVPGGFGAECNTEDAAPAVKKMGPEEMEHALAEVLNRFGLTEAAPEMLQNLAAKEPRLFFAAGVARLQLEGGPPGHRKRSLRLLDTPAFLLELVRSGFFSTQELKGFCAKCIREDSLLDVKLARLMPGRQADDYHLETSLILRILDVLDETSPGPRLLMIIGHLTRHPEKHIASKAALLVGRRLQSREWVERHLASTDARVRANVVESLWGVNSALAARTFRNCLRDENNRVRGNALIGLHLMGDQSIGWRIRHLANDSRPRFRQTAAWLIGMLGDPELVPLLEGLLIDSDQAVRQSAANALGRLRAAAPDADEAACSLNKRMETVQVSTQTEPQVLESTGEDESAASTPEIVLRTMGRETKGTTGENASCELAGNQEGKDELQRRGSTFAKFNLRLDGRYVTGG